jgi:hypothetical protein
LVPKLCKGDKLKFELSFHDFKAFALPKEATNWLRLIASGGSDES